MVIIMNKRDIDNFAHQTLLDHGMLSIPVDPVLLANRLGIRVSNAVFSESSLSGMIAKRGEKHSLLVNDSDNAVRKRFTIAHELGHCLLHLQNDGEYVDREIDLFRTESQDISGLHLKEVQANQFAAALLMDAELVKETWPHVRDIQRMAELFHVSESAMGYRLSNLRLT